MGSSRKEIDPTSLEIRPLTKKDIPEIIAIESQSFPSPWSDRLFLNELEHTFSFFSVLLLNDRLIGYAGFWLVANEAHITNLAIHPDFRRQGLGLLFVSSLLDLAYDQGARCATLEVRSSNSAAIKLYTNLNFTDVALRKNYYPATGEDAIVMWLTPLSKKQ